MTEEFAGGQTGLGGQRLQGGAHPKELPTEDLFCNIAEAPNGSAEKQAVTSAWPGSSNLGGQGPAIRRSAGRGKGWQSRQQNWTAVQASEFPCPSLPTANSSSRDTGETQPPETCRKAHSEETGNEGK